MHPDQKYIDALLSNDSAGIREIYDRYSREIAIWVCRNQGTETQAKDVFQDSLLAITLQARQNGLTLTCPFGAFLFLVARGRWLNELKKQKGKTVTIDELPGLSDISSGDHLLSEKVLLQESRERLFMEKFEKLGAKCREIIRLSWDGMGMEAVAAKLGLTYGYVRKKKSECIAALVDAIHQDACFHALKSQP